MSQITLSIPDDSNAVARMAGIAAAREAYNARRSAEEPGPFETDEAYLNFAWADRATESYAKQYGFWVEPVAAAASEGDET